MAARPIEESWDDFCAQCVAEADEDQLRIGKLTFFAGAAALFGLFLSALADAEPGVTVADLQTELDAFHDEVAIWESSEGGHVQ